MDGQDWDHHRRLVSQAGNDKKAQATRTIIAANAALRQAQARGRSQQRGSGNRARFSSVEDDSRSRSRSFNLPLRGWGMGGGGERRQRWMSQDSAHAVGETEESVGGDLGPSESSSGDSNGSGRDGGEKPAEVEIERSGRSRSFFAFAEKLRVMGGGQRRASAAVETGEIEDQSVAIEGHAKDEGGNDRGRKKSSSLFGVNERRRSKSIEGTMRSADRGAGGDGSGGTAHSRSRVFSSSSRDTIAPSIDPSPPSANGESSSNSTAAAAAAAATANNTKPAGVSAAAVTDTKNNAVSRSRSDRRQPSNFRRSNSLGRDDGWIPMTSRTRTVSAATSSVDVKSSQNRGRAVSTAVVGLEQVTAQSPMPTSEQEASVGGSGSIKMSRWKLPRRRRSLGSTADDPGAAMGKKNVWGSLQVCRV